MNVRWILACYGLLCGAFSTIAAAAQPTTVSEFTEGRQTVAAAASRYDVGPIPAWVQALDVPLSSGATASGAAQSARNVEYLLLDRQAKADLESSYYTRIAVHLLNAAGVESDSQITLNFDPEQERLIVHSVILHRGSQTFDELKLGRIEILQREPSLENGVLDGALTFHLVMSDVRVGDVIEYAYTIERRRTEWGNRFLARYGTRWVDPVARSRLRILARVGAALSVSDHGGQEPSKSTEGDWEVSEWNWTNVAPYRSEDHTPTWFDQSAAIEFSQFANWQDVVEAALPLYAIPRPHSPELTEMAERIRTANASDVGRALAVLRFAQEEVRYTGVELGERAFRPAAPEEVLRHRYGDCKDKALLTVALLRELGIDAAPALVSTRWKEHARDQLASPTVFNHAIVRVRLRGVTYWLDPTTSAQGGTLLRYRQGNYGAALVLEPGVKELETIPTETAVEPTVFTTTSFDIRSGWHKEAKLSVSTIYRGVDADSMRASLRTKTNDELANSYLNYYKRRYPEIRSAASLATHDDVLANELKVDEFYLIPNAFQPGDGDDTFEVESDTVNGHLRAPGTTVRMTPLGLNRSTHVAERIELLLPERVSVDEKSKVIAGPGFEYRSRVARTGNDLNLEYRYTNLADQVPVAKLDEFLKKREAARVDTFFSLSIPTPKGASGTESGGPLAAALQKAYQLIQAGEEAKARPVIDDMVASKDFESLAPELRRAALLLAAALAYDTRDGARALDLSKRASEYEESGPEEWTLRLTAGMLVRDHADAASTLASITQRWPESVKKLDVRLVAQVVRQSPTTGVIRYRLLKALYDADFTAEGYPPASWWHDLALLQLERGERNEAAQTLSHIADPHVAISILADRRFDIIRTEISNQLDVGEAANQAIDLGRDMVRRNPDKLQPFVQLSHALLYAGRSEDALQLCDEVIAKVEAATASKPYTDVARSYVWLLNNRSEALFDLGRWDDAVAQLVTASHLPEHQDDNVSQIINLAGLYNALARPTEAKEALTALDRSKSSPYGLTQVAIELLRSAVQLGDAEEIERQLQFLREHRDDSVRTLEHALVRAGREDEAAALLISRLADLNERVPALMEVQGYVVPSVAKGEQKFLEQWSTLIRRPDVQQAIAKVGNAGKYPVRQRGF